MNTEFLVYITCSTYNHSDFIKNALDGFCMQETNFPFICGIVDDASTDGEQAILLSYLEENFDLENELIMRKDETEDYTRVFAQHKSNKNCFFVVVLLKNNHYSIHKSRLPYVAEWRTAAKYIAVCEGDDYWIEPKKLQLQIDFLNSHTDFSMCFHGAKIVISSGSFNKQRLQLFSGLETREYSGEELVTQWIVPTASIVYRSNIKVPIDSRFAVGDLVLRNQCSIEGRVFCFADAMSVYRLNEGSTTSKPFPFEKSFPHMEALIEHFPQYRAIYKKKYSIMIKQALKSRQCFRVLVYLLKHPYLIKYIF